jgi:glucose-6-phosphate 1-dehydrogenase
MQLIALVAMEPPVGFDADYVRNEKVKIFNTIRSMDLDILANHTVFGQYGEGYVNGVKVPSYREEENVSPGSITPTFFAARFFIDNWRWADIPFYIKTGKRLHRRVTEISIQFKLPPLRLFGRSCDVLESYIMKITIQPEEEITLTMGIKHSDERNMIYRARMNFNYHKTFGVKDHPPYERLILDCMKGDLTLFARQDGIEAMWSVVDPITEYWENNPVLEFPNYSAGTWGPDAAERLIKKDGFRWHTL